MSPEEEIAELKRRLTQTSIRYHKETEKAGEEWRELHDWCLNFRKKHNLTCARFLELCNLPPRASFILLLVSTGRLRNPSTKPGTMGNQIREVLRHARDQPPNPSRASKPSVKELLEDYYLERKVEMKKKGIIALFITNEIPLHINVGVNPSCILKKNDLAELFTINGISPTSIDVDTYVYAEGTY